MLIEPVPGIGGPMNDSGSRSVVPRAASTSTRGPTRAKATTASAPSPTTATTTSAGRRASPAATPRLSSEATARKPATRARDGMEIRSIIAA